MQNFEKLIFDDFLKKFCDDGVVLKVLIIGSEQAGIFLNSKGFAVYSFKDLPFNTLFDAIFCEKTEEPYFSDKDKIIDFAFQNLKPGGFCFINNYSCTSSVFDGKFSQLLFQNYKMCNCLCIQKTLRDYFKLSKHWHKYKNVFFRNENRVIQSYKDFEVFRQITEAHGINYFAFHGTAIGLVRHGGMVPWDNDLDFCFLSDDWDKLIALFPIFESNKLPIRIGEGVRKKMKRGWRPLQIHIGYIDCFLMKERRGRGAYRGRCKGHVYKWEHQTCCKQVFGNRYINAPLNMHKSLCKRYSKDYFVKADLNDKFHQKGLMQHIQPFALTDYDKSFFVC